MTTMTGEYIGIDLGTTYSSVGVWRNDRVEVIANEQGNYTTPSCVAFMESEHLMVGDDAKLQVAMNVHNTVYDVKRLIGRKISDPFVQESIKNMPFSVASRKYSETLFIETEHNDEKRSLRVEEITAVIIRKMCDIAKVHLGKEIENAVITVPANFNNSQRQATKDASCMAGLKDVLIINEPMAAAIAYGLVGNESDVEKNVLIFDLGGGTCDVSLLGIEDHIYEVKATAGDTCLGGEDFDQRMVDFLALEFKRRYRKDMLQNPRSVCRLRAACERAKRTLSKSTRASIEITSLYDGIDFDYSFGRARFEDLCRDYFEKCIGLCEKVLKDSKVPKENVHDIVLVGGSTHIPKIQLMLTDFFGGKELCKHIGPEEAVVHGATIQAAILTGADRSERLPDVISLDVTPLEIGVLYFSGSTETILKRNTTFPIYRIWTVRPHVRSGMMLWIYEGESLMACSNNLLGTFYFDNFPPLPIGQAQVDVKFNIDKNGILSLSAVETSTGFEHKLTVLHDTGHLSCNEIQSMAKQIKTYKICKF